MSIRYFNEGGVTDPLVGQTAGQESSLSSWVGPYVTDMLGKGQALSETPYEAYTGPLTAGASQAQQNAFTGIAGLNVPTGQMGAFTPGTFTDPNIAQNYMNPYLQASLDPQIAEARRQADISRVAQAGRLGKAGAFGGSRQAVMESELDRNMLRNVADITGRGYERAFTEGRQQFNTEQDRERAAQELVNRYGLDALKAQADIGAQERAIETEAVDAARQQFEEERLYPFKTLQFQQSLLQDLPLEAFQRTFIEPSQLSQFSGSLSAIQDFINEYGGKVKSNAESNQALVDSMVDAGLIDRAAADEWLATSGMTNPETTQETQENQGT